MCAGPRKKDTTISPENFGRMLSNLPVTKTDIAIGGGEIFTVFDHVVAYLDLIRQQNSSRDRKSRIVTSLQTNGFWLKRKDARDILGYLKDQGVSLLDIASKDDYHREQGLSLSSANVALANRFIKTKFRGVGRSIMPLGRAAHLDVYYYMGYDCKKVSKQNMSSSPRRWELTIRNDGSVSPCCYSLLRYEGNIFSESLESILKRARGDPDFQALSTSGLGEVLRRDGVPQEVIDI
jgi:MoaA/NifB/PqqE/SkfB family radical SAM enzyme